jgi:hypothetical protein
MGYYTHSKKKVDTATRGTFKVADPTRIHLGEVVTSRLHDGQMQLSRYVFQYVAPAKFP